MSSGSSSQAKSTTLVIQQVKLSQPTSGEAAKPKAEIPALKVSDLNMVLTNYHTIEGFPFFLHVRMTAGPA
jgi:hypothetical protein